MTTVAFSPCPNDVFIFGGWWKAAAAPLPLSVHLGDIQTLNQWAFENRHDVSKVSFHCLGRLLDNYLLLPVGAALGKKCGPKLIAATPSCTADIKTMRIAIPGKDTTAHLLFQLFADSPREKVFCRYEEIPDLLRSGRVDAGVIIHETRFTFAKMGFHEILDFGQLWEEKTGLELPLGGLIAKRTLPTEHLEAICDAIQISMDWAEDHPEEILQEVMLHSQEKNPDVVRQHISLYVNEETRCLSDRGVCAINTLLEMSAAKGLIPCHDKKALFSCTQKTVPCLLP